jgi:hypothetical protein
MLLLAAAIAVHAAAPAAVVNAQHKPLGGSNWTASLRVENDGAPHETRTKSTRPPD